MWTLRSFCKKVLYILVKRSVSALCSQFKGACVLVIPVHQFNLYWTEMASECWDNQATANGWSSAVCLNPGTTDRTKISHYIWCEVYFLVFETNVHILWVVPDISKPLIQVMYCVCYYMFPLMWGLLNFNRNLWFLFPPLSVCKCCSMQM